jgi:hypothetical protein
MPHCNLQYPGRNHQPGNRFRPGWPWDHAVIAVTAVACLVSGLVMGWLTRSVLVTAQISHAQERMQRKVRYWQSETVRARATAERLARRLAAGELPPDESGWLPPDGY